MAEAPLADLEIRIDSRGEDRYRVELTLDGEQHFGPGEFSGEGLAAYSSRHPGQGAGEKLFKLLIQGAGLEGAWGEIQGRTGGRARVRLRVDPGEEVLHGVPWELMETGGQMICASGNSPFSRYLPVSVPWSGALDAESVKLLAVVAAPVDLEEEFAAVQEEAERGVLRSALDGKVELHFLEPPVTLDRLRDKLAEGFHMLHIVAHGSFGVRSKAPFIFLEEDDSRAARPVYDHELAGLIARQESRPHLVTLAACQGAARSSHDGLRGMAPRLVQAGVPAVVAMQEIVSVDAARAFTAAFYPRLLEHRQVDLALNQARDALICQQSREAAVPVLYMRLRSGELWHAEADARCQMLGSGRRGSRTFWKGLVDSIKYGECTPIIGPRVHGRFLPTTRTVAQAWAEEYGYPYPDRGRLARVAQYLAINHGVALPRRKLRETLKVWTCRGLPDQDRPAALDDVHKSLDELVKEVGWAKLVRSDLNEAHRTLAGLGLPLFLTTNPDPCMYEALASREEEGLPPCEPERECCPWNREPGEGTSIFDGGDAYEPSPARPLVYHLFGRDKQQDSLVLTEDDHLSFLAGISAVPQRVHPIIKQRLKTSRLLFVGYNLFDLELRVLLRGLLEHGKDMDYKHVAVQIDPGEGRARVQGEEEQENAREFLQKYFHQAQISVFLGTTGQFMAELREWWEGR